MPDEEWIKHLKTAESEIHYQKCRKRGIITAQIARNESSICLIDQAGNPLSRGDVKSFGGRFSKINNRLQKPVQLPLRVRWAKQSELSGFQLVLLDVTAIADEVECAS